MTEQVKGCETTTLSPTHTLPKNPNEQQKAELQHVKAITGRVQNKGCLNTK